jgi:hypothetical protein
MPRIKFPFQLDLAISEVEVVVDDHLVQQIAAPGLLSMNKCKFVVTCFVGSVWSFNPSYDHEMSFSPSPSPSEEDDEEWGWGDEDDIELTPSYNSESNLYNRRHSNDSHKKTPGQLPKNSLTKPSTSKTKTPANAALDIPSLPTVQQPPSSRPISGLSVKKAIPIAKLSRAHASAPISAGAQPFGKILGGSINNVPAAPFSLGGAPLDMTSPGTFQPMTTAPKKNSVPLPEDDIFASMGLSAQPTFTHSTASRISTISSTSQRHSTPVVPFKAPASLYFGTQPTKQSTASFGTKLGAGKSFGPTPSRSSNFGATRVKASSSGVGDDEEWGNDKDLDDLLDD